jgi:hypothetical protein
MLAALGIIVVSYICPILIGTLARTDISYSSWTDGTFTEVGVGVRRAFLAWGRLA